MSGEQANYVFQIKQQPYYNQFVEQVVVLQSTMLQLSNHLSTKKHQQTEPEPTETEYTNIGEIYQTLTQTMPK